jgi:hypothetical protein
MGGIPSCLLMLLLCKNLYPLLTTREMAFKRVQRGSVVTLKLKQEDSPLEVFCEASSGTVLKVDDNSCRKEISIPDKPDHYFKSSKSCPAEWDWYHC